VAAGRRRRLYTGQRQGDLLRLPWSAYAGDKLRLKRSKTGVCVAIPVLPELAAVLAKVPRRGPIMLTLHR
jgi:hypothetical protein